MRSILNMILGLDNTMSGVPVTTMNSAVTLSLMNDGADARVNNSVAARIRAATRTPTSRRGRRRTARQ